MKIRALVGALALAGVMAPAFATNGYFSHGYGMKAKGMGGAANAMASDAMGGANNPASMVWVGDRLDLGVDWFRPIRSAQRTGAVTSNGANPVQLNGKMESDKKNFLIPEFGYNKMLNSSMSLGVTVYGNGGMNTDYTAQAGAYTCDADGAPGGATVSANNILCGSSKLGVHLEQLIIAPTLAYKLNQQHSIGVSPLLGYQRFSADGLQAFAGISSDSNNLTNKGHDDAYGFGVRLGWQGRITDTLTLGATYSTKVNMSKFDKYKGLFAEQGDFDIPENYGLGLAWKAMPALTVALDYQRINYGGVKAIANSSRQGGGSCTSGGTCLGGSDGIGFGWKDIDVWKLGFEYQHSKALTLRAGYNHGANPIKPEDVTFNILAPGVVTDHVTLGMTYAMGTNSELTVAYMHAMKKSLTGPGTNPYFNNNGTEKIEMYQDSLGVAYGMKF